MRGFRLRETKPRHALSLADAALVPDIPHARAVPVADDGYAMSGPGQALVFGGSGQIGAALVARLCDAGWRVTALSRSPPPAAAGLRWLRGEFAALPALPSACDAVFSCGPLDLFAQWYAGASVDTTRVIAFGSTSLTVKRDSADASERDLAQRLRDAETMLFATAQARGAGATMLRPTLIYGAASDRTLTRIAAIARRWRCFALPRDATGLRQPAHVDDLAQAAVNAIDAPASHGHAYALPGETLAYREMVARVLAALQPPATLHLLPPALFRTLLSCAHAAGIARDFGDAALARMGDDLVFEVAAAQRDLGYAPRPFRPTQEMFIA